ncbi:MAG: SUMF1/EgtB/PvdO family nonheme iron enzyme [Elusimicrobia bacterium]|nr:SUMF1/EgtB/PvdO family nonheme iron enzyme [Elusimicrobiota bacterium]
MMGKRLGWGSVAAACAFLALACKAPKQGGPARSAATAGQAGIAWVAIPGGSFMMGVEELADSKPRHQVTVETFQMAKTLVTNKQYRACVQAGACTAPMDEGAGFKGDDQPVVGVDWEQAKTFSEWVGGRLPSEAEWEYAARSAGKDGRYPWGDEEATCARAVIAMCGSATAPVCSRPAGNTKQGLCDMAGNAWEWVQDFYHDSYKGAPADGSAWDVRAGGAHVVRGGSWNSGDPCFTRSPGRDLRPGPNHGYLGFRPAR